MTGPLVTGWVTDRTGAVLATDREVAVLALRRNPRRAHLLVSSLLGKHVPARATEVLSAAGELADLVRAQLPDGALVIGFAETATGLGHGVAAALGATTYAHTTRRGVPSGAAVVSFEEEHSHAVEQVLAVRDQTLWRDRSRPVVLVDDELSSGRTAVNAIRVLQQRWPRDRYVLASLLDVRSPIDRAGNIAEVRALGAELSTVALVDGTVHLPPDLNSVAAALVAGHREPVIGTGDPVPVTTWQLDVDAPLTGAYGWSAADERALQRAVDELAPKLAGAGSILVLGDEECLYPGQLLAAALGAWSSSTTRSPALVVDAVGYPLRTALGFGATDDPARAAYAYNVLPSSCSDRGPAPGFDQIVLVLDRPLAPHVRDGLLAQLRTAARSSVQLVLLRSTA